MKRAASLRVALLALVVGEGNGCSTPDVQFEVDLPRAIAGDAKWIEVAAFADRCPPSAQLAGGLPAVGMSRRVAFPAGGPALAMGKLASGSYGFAAVARGADCGVLAAGCTVVDVTRARDVHVVTSAVAANPSTVCEQGSVCNDARCVPPSGVDDPSFGAGCTMQLVGAGPFANALQLDSLQVSMPAVIAAGDGFVAGYTELSQIDGTMRLTLFPIDHNGAALPLPQPETIDGRCMGSFGADATGLAPGLAVLSRPACASKSGIELFPLSADGATTARNIVLAGQAPGPELLLSTRAVASIKASSWVIALRSNGASALEVSDGVTITGSKQFGKPADTAARIARSSGVQVVEAEGPGVSVGDAGAPMGSQARVYLSSAAGDPLAISTPDDQLPATLGAVAALGTRAFVLTDGAGKGLDVVARAYDFGGKGAPLDFGFGLSTGSGPVLALDATASTDRLFVVASRAHAIALEVVDHATSASPAFLREVALADDLRIPQAYVDGSVSIAATPTRVAVVWSNRKALLPFGEPVGGYAVFACR